MGRYLDKFVSTMPDNQARHIFTFLTELRNAGTIKTVEEYNTKLQELTASLDATQPKPLFKRFLAIIGDVIDSDRFNAMVKAIKMDFETAFSEVSNLGTVLEFHKALYKLTVLKALRKAILQLDKKISLYEFFTRNPDFDDGQFNTFDELDDLLDRTDPLAGQFYYDLRKAEAVDSEEDCVIDILGERLVMPAISMDEITASTVELIQDADTTTPDRDLQFDESVLSNIIDHQLHTYWNYPILMDEIQSDGVKIKVHLDLGGTQEINIIRVEPASVYPMELEEIVYVGTDGLTHTIDIGATISKDTNIYVSSFIANELTLLFKQEHYESVAYYYQPDGNVWEDAISVIDPEVKDEKQLDKMSNDLNDAIPNKALSDALEIPERPGWELVTGVQYTFGFDNIRFFSTRYDMRGIFVGKKFDVQKPGVIALKTVEVNPETIIGNSDYKLFSFEYWVAKRNYDENDSFIDFELLPIIPLGYGLNIQNERLWLAQNDGTSDVSNLAILRFVPDDATTPVISKNLVGELTIGTDYTVYVGDTLSPGNRKTTWSDVFTAINAATPDEPLNIRIRFEEPSAGSFYTITYKAQVDWQLSNYARLQKDGYIACNTSRGNFSVARSELFLIAIIRRNYTVDTETAALEEFKLLTASYNPTKYEE